MAVRVPLKQYRLHFRDAYVSVDMVSCTIRVPTYFGSADWILPTTQLVASNLTALSAVETNDEDRDVFERPPLIPYLFTTGPGTLPTMLLLFRTPQRVPALTLVAASGPNVDLGFTRRQSRSAKGVQVDGVLVRIADPGAAVDHLRHAGVELTTDPDRWLKVNRPMVTDPVQRADRLALEDDLIPKHRYLGWASGALLALAVLGANRDNMTLAGVGGAGVAVSLLARFLIERRLKRT